MAITRTDVEKVALLARLHLSEVELDTLTDELAQIVTYVDQLAEVDTDGVEPMEHVSASANVFREDKITPSLDREKALRASAGHDEEFFQVPPVIE